MKKTVYMFACSLLLVACPAISTECVVVNTNAVDSGALITEHNRWRSKVGVQNLKWSDKLAQSARKYAEELASDCTHEHSKGDYGENLYMAGPIISSAGWTKMQSITPNNVVDAWGNEIKYYNYASNSCHGVCGHYTQVVWKTTTEVGCGMAVCNNKSLIWVCQYTPAGNMVGEKPY